MKKTFIIIKTTAALIGLTVFVSCFSSGGGGGDDEDNDAAQQEIQENPNPIVGDWWKPAPGTSWQWQLSGALNTSYDVQMYDIDLVDVSADAIAELKAAGRVVICYFSAGSWEDWRPDAGSFSESVKGNTMDGWPDEKWLDIGNLDALKPIMEARLDLAASKGCDGVEPDNVDGYSNNTGFSLTADEQLNYNRWLADEAHQRGLSIGLKNDLDQVPALVNWFDWALNEQCYEMDECDLLDPFAETGKAVFGVEYEGDPNVFCPAMNAKNFDWLFMDWDLDGNRTACR